MPAPWSIDMGQRGPVQIKSRHGFQVGTALTVDDARLMAAAPELLAALKAGLAAYSHSTEACDCEGDCDEAVALGVQFAELAPLAIAKAEGRTDGA